MANGTMQHCLRESKRRPAGHEAFAQIMARLSELRAQREEKERIARTEQKGD